MASTMAHSGVPKTLWDYAVVYAGLILNRMPRDIHARESAMSIWEGRPVPDAARYLHPFGCLVIGLVFKEQRKKLDPRGKPLIFLGVSNQYRSYVCAELPSLKISHVVEANL